MPSSLVMVQRRTSNRPALPFRTDVKLAVPFAAHRAGSARADPEPGGSAYLVTLLHGTERRSCPRAC